MSRVVYVDDCNITEHLHIAGGTQHITTKKTIVKIHAGGSQQVFEDIELETEEIGLKTNGRKTQLLCVSNAIHSAPSTFISVGEPSKSQQKL